MDRKTCYYMAHEMIKAVLTYEAEAVQEILSRKYKRWKIINIERYRVIATRPELPQKKWKTTFLYDNHFLLEGKIVYPDVIWVLKPHTHGITRYVVHEVKVGKYNIEEVWRKYEGIYVRWGRKRSFAKLTTPNTPLFLWAQRREHKRNLREIEEKGLEIKSLRRGGIRLISIELILPLMRERVLEAGEILGFKSWRRRK